MAFTETFQHFVCVGDSITCEHDGYTFTATIEQDDTLDAPDERQGGFWPSLYIGDAGFIGAGNGFRDRFAKAQAHAEAVMQAWKNDEWFYCGIVISATYNGVLVDERCASLWGIEANYPDSDNSYLNEVAIELLAEAIPNAAAARAAVLVALKATL